MKVLDQSYAATTTLISSDFQARPGPNHCSRAVAYVYSTQAGTVTAYYIDEDYDERQLTAATAVAANDLTILNFAYPLPRMRLKFTPAAATAGVVQIDVYSAG